MTARNIREKSRTVLRRDLFSQLYRGTVCATLCSKGFQPEGEDAEEPSHKTQADSV
jgi:hypothetical protein